MTKENEKARENLVDALKKDDPHSEKKEQTKKDLKFKRKEKD
jgi:hypothetical protein